MVRSLFLPESQGFFFFFFYSWLNGAPAPLLSLIAAHSMLGRCIYQSGVYRGETVALELDDGGDGASASHLPTASYTVKFYDGVIQTVKGIHVKPFIKEVRPCAPALGMAAERRTSVWLHGL